jgi:PleD family two-component response regulator
MKSETRISKMEVVPERSKSVDNPASLPHKGKILLVDSERDRQARIAILKQHGFRVYPALAIEQARSRCRSGAYDLIVLNADSSSQMALELCNQIREKDPKQHVLVITSKESLIGASEPVVSSIPERLLERVQSLLAVLERNRESLIA